MIEIYQKIKIDIPQRRHSMPLSLRYIKELASVGIDWKGLHIIDITSLIYSIRIDNARQKLEMDRQKRMSERGIKEVRKATAADFDAL